jgi:3-oxoacyl-[acyl-carrier protein] reductase
VKLSLDAAHVDVAAGVDIAARAKEPHLLRRDAAGTPAVARGAAHARDVGTHLAREPQIVSRQLSGEGDEQPGVVRIGDPPRQLIRRDQPSQPRPGLVGRIQQNADCAGARRDVHDGRHRQRADATAVAIADNNHSAPSGTGLARPAHRRRRQGRRTRRARHAGESHFDKRNPGRRELARMPLDLGFIRGVAERRGHRTGVADDGANLLQHVNRNGAERAGQRILGVDQIGAAGQRVNGFSGRRHAYEQSHRVSVARFGSTTVCLVGHVKETIIQYAFMTTDPVASLADRAMLVTGASSGIGRAIALAAARAGADVAITYRRNEHGARDTEREIAAIGRRVAVIQLDLADLESVRAVGPAARDALGRLDVWVNNAGADILTGEGGSLTRVQKVDMVLTVDVRGTMLASWHAAEMFAAQEGGGVIINMSWDHVTFGMEGTNPQIYGAAKGAVLSFSKCLARSVAPRVRVNILAPGWIETSFGEGLDDTVRRTVAASTPLKRWGVPDDVAGAAVFLASPAASFLTGQTIMIGGGIVM